MHLSSSFAVILALLWLAPSSPAEVNKAEQIGPGIFFHEGEIEGKGHCNNGWIIFRDYVLVVDANFPSGAQEILPKIKAQTDKPVRFAFDTHHHGDHAYGNQFWVDQGAVAVAHAGVVEEMKRYEPQRWNDTAKSRKDVGASKLSEPTLLYQKDMVFDDGEHRVELLHLGVAHTHGDGFAWLPKEKILFTGDACVNGAYNYTADGNIEQWIQTLEVAKKLGARVICPGHGPLGQAALLAEQQGYFVELRKAVLPLRSESPEKVKASLPAIRDALLSNPKTKKFVGSMLSGQVEKVYTELGGKPFAPAAAALDDHKLHLVAHGDQP